MRWDDQILYAYDSTGFVRFTLTEPPFVHSPGYAVSTWGITMEIEGDDRIISVGDSILLDAFGSQINHNDFQSFEFLETSEGLVVATIRIDG